MGKDRVRFPAIFIDEPIQILVIEQAVEVSFSGIGHHRFQPVIGRHHYKVVADIVHIEIIYGVQRLRRIMSNHIGEFRARVALQLADICPAHHKIHGNFFGKRCIHRTAHRQKNTYHQKQRSTNTFHKLLFYNDEQHRLSVRFCTTVGIRRKTPQLQR